MKITGGYIFGFGMISDESFDIDEGFNCIIKNNGEGKTTFSAFVKAMLYGMRSTTKRDKEMGDRERYLPATGVKYGGALSIRCDNGDYTVERVFDRTSEPKDLLTVHDGYGRDVKLDNVGEFLLGINADSFERTAFFSLGDTATEVGGDIGAKLGPLAIGKVNAEDAVERLEAEMKKYRHKTGRNGPIDEKKREFALLGEKIRELTGKENDLEDIKGEIAQAEKRLADLKKTDERLKAAELRLEKRKTYNSILEDIEKEKASATAILEKYPKGIPSEKDRERIGYLLENIKRIKDNADAPLMSEEKMLRLDGERKRFFGGVPDGDYLSKMSDMAVEHSTLAKKLSVPPEADGEFSRLQKRFGINTPDESVIEKVRNIVSNDTAAPKKGIKKTAMSIALALFVAMVGVGVALVGVNLILAVAIMAAGVVGAMASGFIYLLKRTEQLQPTDVALLPLIAPYGYSVGEGKLFLSEYEWYKALFDKNATAIAVRESDEKRFFEIEKQLKDVLTKYSIECTNFADGINTLRFCIKEFAALGNEFERAKNDREQAAADLAILEKELSDLMLRYGFERTLNAQDLLKNSAVDAKLLEDSKKRLDNLSERAKAEAPADEDGEPEPQIDAEEIRVAIEEQADKITSLKIEENGLKNIIAQKVELSEKSDRLRLEINEMEFSYQIAKHTRDIIVAVDRKMKEEYALPMNKSFLSYAELLEDKLTGARLDEKFSLSYDENGTLHRFSQLSSGERALVSLCMRLSLIDNIYKSERPFLLLDDPFAELDAEHFERASGLLLKVSENMQIIYFTCHESRTIEHK